MFVLIAALKLQKNRRCLHPLNTIFSSISKIERMIPGQKKRSEASTASTRDHQMDIESISTNDYWAKVGKQNTSTQTVNTDGRASIVAPTAAQQLPYNHHRLVVQSPPAAAADTHIVSLHRFTCTFNLMIVQS